MSHHSSEPLDEMMNEFYKKEKSKEGLGERFEKAIEQFSPKPPKELLGATGFFPDGKITEKDEGQIQFACTVKDGVLILNFGKPCSWVGLTSAEAKSFAEYLIHKAPELR